ncbi:hypothetical protein SNE40_003613 [Patella caerulea]|uniref:Uncharacterized protein n=1 Tax=Patella caerulea TaxID=87958 RepID=A0AAN8KGV2_PATCE
MQNKKTVPSSPNPQKRKPAATITSQTCPGSEDENEFLRALTQQAKRPKTHDISDSENDMVMEERDGKRSSNKFNSFFDNDYVHE